MKIGLDISTSAIGYCILENDKIVKIGAIELSKTRSIFEKAKKFRDTIIDLKSTYEIKQIFIEENLQAFRPGLSSAKTIVTLARFNGMCSLISFDIFKIEPCFVNVNAARKLIGFKKQKNGQNTKDQIIEFVMDLERDIHWPTKILKGGPRKGTEVLQNYCYDMADAYVIVKSQAM